MLIDTNTNNFIILNSSFTTSLNEEDEDDIKFLVEEGAVLSNVTGEGFASSKTTGQFEEQPVYIGITTPKSGKTDYPTGVAIYTEEQKNEKNTDDEDHWTWVEIIDQEGGVFQLGSDIILTEPQPVLVGSHKISFESYNNEDGEEELFVRASTHSSSFSEEDNSVSKLIPLPTKTFVNPLTGAESDSSVLANSEFILTIHRRQRSKQEKDILDDEFELIAVEDYPSSDLGREKIALALIKPLARTITKL
tara:strand:+ start:3490 stop:4236 length:747 start_codon:yes stop_codon:yes gene_type:complete